MSTIRFAKEDETNRQKELWKLCFNDTQDYIDFYYDNRYRASETVVLLHDEQISAMLTMIPVKTVIPNLPSIETNMFYAIATHPNYQNRGFATQLLDFCTQDLRASNKDLSILVPANSQLFDFYRKQGYQDGFCLRETCLTLEMIENLPNKEASQFEISAISAEKYNLRRNDFLKGTFHVKYADEDIAYQKKLSRLSGADIYALDLEETRGCLAIERITSDRVVIKEILIPDILLSTSIKHIGQQVLAKEYFIRTPSYLGAQLGGLIRPFGMIRAPRDVGLEIIREGLGYLGFAFD